MPSTSSTFKYMFPMLFLHMLYLIVYIIAPISARHFVSTTPSSFRSHARFQVPLWHPLLLAAHLYLLSVHHFGVVPSQQLPSGLFTVSSVKCASVTGFITGPILDVDFSCGSLLSSTTTFSTFMREHHRSTSMSTLDTSSCRCHLDRSLGPSLASLWLGARPGCSRCMISVSSSSGTLRSLHGRLGAVCLGHWRHHWCHLGCHLSLLATLIFYDDLQHLMRNNIGAPSSPLLTPLHVIS